MKNGALVLLILRLKRHSCFGALLWRKGAGQGGARMWFCWGSDSAKALLRCECMCVYFCSLFCCCFQKKQHVHPVRPSIPGPSTCAVHAFISVLHFVVVASKAYLSSQMLNTCAK